MNNNNQNEQLSRFALDLEILERRVSIPNNPYKYAPLGGHIMERIYYLKSNYPDSELIQEYTDLYQYWYEINATLTADPGMIKIDNDKSNDICNQIL